MLQPCREPLHPYRWPEMNGMDHDAEVLGVIDRRCVVGVAEVGAELASAKIGLVKAGTPRDAAAELIPIGGRQLGCLLGGLHVCMDAVGDIAQAHRIALVAVRGGVHPLATTRVVK